MEVNFYENVFRRNGPDSCIRGRRRKKVLALAAEGDKEAKSAWLKVIWQSSPDGKRI